jgi:ABC-2 type transport system ATP-binding protein
MHRPALAILDEPTLGLDPLMSQAFYDILNEAREEGRTIFLSSHVLSEIEQICDRVAVLRAGRLQAVERIADMKRALYRWVTVITPHLLNHVDWAALPGVSEAHLIPDGVRLRVTGSMDAVVKLAARYPVQDLRVEEPSLEDFFMTFYGGSNGRHG